jgi:hypothetical protein
MLIQSETGTGKGVLAHWLHQNGSMGARRFVVLNCAGRPKELLETALFGYEKGAFTGAVQTKVVLLAISHKHYLPKLRSRSPATVRRTSTFIFPSLSLGSGLGCSQKPDENGASSQKRATLLQL